MKAAGIQATTYSSFVRAAAMMRPIVPAAAPGRHRHPPFAHPDQPFTEKGGQRHSFTPAIGVSSSEGSHLRRPEAVMAEEYRSLMARYQAGDVAAFESLYGLLAPELRRLALGVQHGSPADDVV